MLKTGGGSVTGITVDSSVLDAEVTVPHLPVPSSWRIL
jgi:hypothetical protein